MAIDQCAGSRTMALPGAGFKCHFGDLMWNNEGMDVRLDTSFELLLERAPVAHGSRVLATVVKTAGSTYSKPGVRMLLIRPEAAHRVTVLGSTRKSVATSPGVSKRSLVPSIVHAPLLDSLTAVASVADVR